MMADQRDGEPALDFRGGQLDPGSDQFADQVGPGHSFAVHVLEGVQEEYAFIDARDGSLLFGMDRPWPRYRRNNQDRQANQSQTMLHDVPHQAKRTQ
jgi:hypothetical protein